MFENKILDELFEMREEGFTRWYIAKYGESKESKKTEKAENELVEFMKKFISKEEDIEKMFNLLNKFESLALDEMCFWHKPYYKLGFIDATNLKKEIEEEKITDNNRADSIIYKNIYEITDFFEEQKYKNLKQNNDYMKIGKDIEEIKEKFPKVRSFFEDNEITEFSKEEMKAILNIIELQEDRAMYEADEMLKIGLREGKAL